MHLVLNLHLLYFLVDPFVVNNQGLSAVPSCELSRLLENLELRYAFNTLAAVTPDRTPYPKIRNAFGVNRRETFLRTLRWGTDFEGIDKQDLAVELCLIFFCATMTSLTRVKTEYILAYRGRDGSRKIVHKQIKNDAGVIMSTTETGLELSVKISENTKTQIPHVVRSEGLSKNKVRGQLKQ